MKITFLGTGSMIPTKNRNHNALLIKFRDENILLDCGDGTQRQLIKAGFSPPRLTRLIITHWHGDHFLGLPGLIENLAKNQYHGTFPIYGVPGSIHRINLITEAMILQGKLHYEVHEVHKDGVFIDESHFTVAAMYLKHSAPCMGISFQEKDRRNIDVRKLKKLGIPKEGVHLAPLHKGKNITWNKKVIKANDVTSITTGKKVTFIFDTGVTPACVKLAKNSDVLVCESTFGKEHTKKAREYTHLTNIDAATIAKKANVKKLVLSHFSQRYKDTGLLIKEAKKIFPKTIAAEDFLTIEI